MATGSDEETYIDAQWVTRLTTEPTRYEGMFCVIIKPVGMYLLSILSLVAAERVERSWNGIEESED